jgi:dolichol-phosphate mannosyltransferase
MVLAFDIIFAFSKRPMKLATNLEGVPGRRAGLVIYVFVSKYTSPLPGWASTLIIIIFFGGVQLLTLGIVGEYIGIIFDEVKGRPEYVVDERVNFGLRIQD